MVILLGEGEREREDLAFLLAVKYASFLPLCVRHIFLARSFVAKWRNDTKGEKRRGIGSFGCCGWVQNG